MLDLLKFIRKVPWYSCVFATIEYSSESLCASMCVCFCVCVFLHENAIRNWSRNMKFKYIVVYENNSDKFDIGHCRTRSRSQR